ncbi:hypothetical protein L6241_08110 [Janibacter sp. Y6]|uniref:glycosyltransferase n=1 Tax=Janibacter sp. Y6 TaxID=2913552 RepID=UPI0034A374E7
MTPAPPQHAPETTAAPSRRAPEAPPAVATVLLARSADDAAETVAGLLAQSHLDDAPGAADRQQHTVLLVDASPSGLDVDAVLAPVREAGLPALSTRLDPRRGLRRSLPELVESLPTHADRRDLVWVLTSRCRPRPDALHALVAAVSRGVAMATPKVVDVADEGVLVRQGLQVTRAGRLVPTPVCGERDQGQHDDSVDVLAGPLEGLLLDRDEYLALGGHDPGLGDLGGDLDLGWRAQRCGHRVVAVPTAVLAVRPWPVERRPGLRHRAQARRVALARGPLWAAPVRALGGALLALLTALGLLLLKRPGLAREELALVRGSLDPRTLTSLRRRGGRPTVDRRELATLFVPAAQARQRLADDIRGHHPGGGVDARASGAEATGLLRSPVPLLLLAAVAMSAWAGRQITGELRHRFDAGLVGGELLGGRATSGSLLASWRDAWSGAGAGSDLERSPAVLLLAAASWVVEHVPGGGDADSPAGVALSLFVLAALPLGAVVAYRSARVVTTARWVRALLALGWISTPAAAAAAGEGRVGPLLAVVLLPRVAAGLVRAARRGPGISDAVRTALWAAVLGSLVPALAVPVLLVGVALLLLGRPGRRGRGVVLLALPLLLAGPWLLTLRAEPERLLAGWGATARGPLPEAWRLAAAAPGGPGEIPLWWYLPVALLALLGLLLARGPLPWAAGLVVVLGAAAAVGSPFVVLGEVPAGLADAGAEVRPWPGVGGLLVALGVLSLAGLGLAALPAATSRARRALQVLPVLVLAGGVVGSAALVADTGFGDELTTWRDDRPQIAVDAAEGPLAGRTLSLGRTDDGAITYRLVGREAPDLVRDLPAPLVDEGLSDDVAALLGVGPSGRTPVDAALGAWGVGFVTMHDPSSDDQVAVDATPGLRRLSTSAGTTTWSVRPESTGSTTPSRVRYVGGADGARNLVGLRDHSESTGVLRVPGQGRVVVGEPIGWTEHAVVTGDGAPLVLDTRSSVPTYAVPAGTREVEIDVRTGHAAWKWLVLGSLVVGLYLALPTERRPDPQEEQ